MENYIFIKCLEFYFDFNEMFQALFLCLLLLGTQGVGLNFFNYRKLLNLVWIQLSISRVILFVFFKGHVGHPFS